MLFDDCCCFIILKSGGGDAIFEPNIGECKLRGDGVKLLRAAVGIVKSTEPNGAVGARTNDGSSGFNSSACN